MGGCQPNCAWTGGVAEVEYSVSDQVVFRLEFRKLPVAH